VIDVATDSNTVAKTYTWGLDLSGDLQRAGGVGGLLCVTENPDSSNQNPYYPSYDANGNVSEYIDDSDSVVAHYEYSPFGKITNSSGSKAADFNHRFSTKYQDTETSLYYYGFRYYSNELGRWLNRDPKEESGGLNLYVFVGNNTVMHLDALGLIWNVPIDHSMQYRPTASPKPNVSDHLTPSLGGAEGYLGEEEWFEERYSGWIEHAKSDFTSDINTWVENNPGEGQFSEPTDRKNIYPYYGNTGTHFTLNPREYYPGQNETKYGDAPQTKHEADKVLGSFSIDAKTPVIIDYLRKSGVMKYSWQTEMYVYDVLGLQSHDPPFKLLGDLFPTRGVERARWNISGSGEIPIDSFCETGGY